MPAKPKLGVFKFASCDGCQLSLLDCEDELLKLFDVADVAFFLEATSRQDPGPYDVALVEGSISTSEDAARIQEVRRQCRQLVTIGACATAGGIQALRNGADADEFIRAVYASPQYIHALATSTPIAEHVRVDFELRGCPINHRQLIETLTALLAGRRPRTPAHSVCVECKRRGNVCVTVAQGIPCLGPVTQAGCGGICPAYDRGCYACFGPAPQANLISLGGQMTAAGQPAAQVAQALQTFNGYAPEFRQASRQLLDQAGDGAPR